jgi:hypothetical protein
MSTFLDDIFGPITQDLLGSLGKPVTMTLAPAGGDYDPSAPIERDRSDVHGLCAGGIRGPAEVGRRPRPGRRSAAVDRRRGPGDAAGTRQQLHHRRGHFTIPTARAIKPIYSGEDVAMWVVLANRG